MPTKKKGILMAYIKANIRSNAFSRSIVVDLYFPTDLPEQTGNKVNGVITLLHGLGNSGDDWMMFSSACRYAADNGYILVAPSIENSFYLDPQYGTPTYTLLTQELPKQLQAIFHIPTERSKNYVAGLSMGGYGALLLGLSNPECYSAIGSFSGAVDMGIMLEATKYAFSSGSAPFASIFTPLFGDDLNLTPQADLFALLQNVSTLTANAQPQILQTCGLQDNDDMQILTQNINFAQFAKTLPLAKYEYKTWNGLHEWNFWDRSLAEFIGFIQNSDYAQKKKQDWM